MSSLNNEDLQLTFNVRVTGIDGPDCLSAASFALKVLEHKLSKSMKETISGTIVEIKNGVINSGAYTIAEEKKIILDGVKNSLSLVDAEDYLVQAGILEKGDWTKSIQHTMNNPWSCLSYQLVHEFGHIIDGQSMGYTYHRLSTKYSPTKYGSTSETESFAEAFTYWIFDLPIRKEATQSIRKLL